MKLQIDRAMRGLGDGSGVGIIPVVLGGGIPLICLHRQIEPDSN